MDFYIEGEDEVVDSGVVDFDFCGGDEIFHFGNDPMPISMDHVPTNAKYIRMSPVKKTKVNKETKETNLTEEEILLLRQERDRITTEFQEQRRTEKKKRIEKRMLEAKKIAKGTDISVKKPIEVDDKNDPSQLSASVMTQSVWCGLSSEERQAMSQVQTMTREDVMFVPTKKGKLKSNVSDPYALLEVYFRLISFQDVSMAEILCAASQMLVKALGSYDENRKRIKDEADIREREKKLFDDMENNRYIAPPSKTQRITECHYDIYMRIKELEKMLKENGYVSVTRFNAIVMSVFSSAHQMFSRKKSNIVSQQRNRERLKTAAIQNAPELAVLYK